MKNLLNNKAIYVAIPMISVLIMLIMGEIPAVAQYSWYAVFAGGILMAILGAAGFGRNGNDKDEDTQGRGE